MIKVKSIFFNVFMICATSFILYFLYSNLEMLYINKLFDHDIQKGVIQKYVDYDSIKSEYHSVGGGSWFKVEDLGDKKMIYVGDKSLSKEKAFFVYEINKDMSYSLKRDVLAILYRWFLLTAKD